MGFNRKYAKYYDLFNSEKDYTKEVDFLEEVFKNFKVNSVLDLGCGTGIHSQELSLRGYRVIGIDISEEMINLAREKQGEEGKFFVGDMKKFNIKERFDACVSMFSSFGYVTKNSEIDSSIDCIKNHLKKRGLLILDIWNGLGVIRELPSRRKKTMEKGNLEIVRESSPNLDSFNHVCDVDFRVNIYEKGKLVDNYGESHKVRFFFPQEIKKYLEEKGFKVIRFCKSYQMDKKPDEKDWNMCVIAELE